jgi:hypothetical protein
MSTLCHEQKANMLPCLNGRRAEAGVGDCDRNFSGATSEESRRAKEVQAAVAVAEQPKQETEQKLQTATPATPIPATQPAAPATQVVSKQQLTVMQLTVALREQRQIEVKPEMLTQDGKYILINIGPTWPTLRLGSNGGVVLPEIRSYKEGLETWLHADELLAKQNARDAKRTAAPPAQPVKPEAKKDVATTSEVGMSEASEVKKETTTEKKAKADAAIEQQLSA